MRPTSAGVGASESVREARTGDGGGRRRSGGRRGGRHDAPPVPARAAGGEVPGPGSEAPMRRPGARAPWLLGRPRRGPRACGDEPRRPHDRDRRGHPAGARRAEGGGPPPCGARTHVDFAGRVPGRPVTGTPWSGPRSALGAGDVRESAPAVAAPFTVEWSGATAILEVYERRGRASGHATCQWRGAVPRRRVRELPWYGAGAGPPRGGREGGPMA
jgi:hypothetical protein